jgi:hypothetical protein
MYSLDFVDTLKNQVDETGLHWKGKAYWYVVKKQK